MDPLASHPLALFNNFAVTARSDLVQAIDQNINLWSCASKTSAKACSSVEFDGEMYIRAQFPPKVDSLRRAQVSE